MRAAALFASLTAFTAISIAGIVLADTAPAAGADLLKGTQWQLVSLGETAIGDDITTTLVFADDGSVGGNGGCNTYGGSITYAGETEIEITQIISTMMYCGDAEMAQERGYFDALEKTAGYALETAELILLDDSGAVLAVLRAQ